MGTTVGGTERRLRLLASAIAGREVELRVGDGPAVYTDGAAIYVPVADERAPLDVAIVVHGALLAAGSVDPAVVSPLVRRKDLAGRYLTLEARRAVASLRDVVPAPVEALVEGCWDGPVSSSPAESVQRVLDGEDVPAAPLEFGCLHPDRITRRNGPAGPSARRSRNTDEHEAPESDGSSQDDEEDAGRLADALSSPLAAGENPLQRMVRKIFGVGTTPLPDEGSGGSDAAVVAGRRAVDEVRPSARRWKWPPRPPKTAASPLVPDASYDEWDFEKSAYRRRWCDVVELTPRPAPDGEEGGRSERDRPLERRIARLGSAHRRHNRQADGDSLDPDALIDLATARAVGDAGDDRIYQARLNTGRDLGVLVLLDASGSTTDRNHGGATVWHQQRRLAARLVTALERSGDRVAAFAFRSQGRNNVWFLALKDFGDRFDGTARLRLAGLEPAGFTRLGAAVRHGTHLLRRDGGCTNLVLVVISDGFAFEHDYRGPYAEHDVRRALEEATGRGIGCVCLTVGAPTDPEPADRLWADMPHLWLPDAGGLEAHVEGLFRQALRLGAGGPTSTNRRRQHGHRQ